MLGAAHTVLLGVFKGGDEKHSALDEVFQAGGGGRMAAAAAAAW